jgi:hypothetical protein
MYCKISIRFLDRQSCLNRSFSINLQSRRQGKKQETKNSVQLDLSQRLISSTRFSRFFATRILLLDWSFFFWGRIGCPKKSLQCLMPDYTDTNHQLQLLTRWQDEKQILSLEIESTLLLKERSKIRAAASDFRWVEFSVWGKNKHIPRSLASLDPSLIPPNNPFNKNTWSIRV